MPSPEEFVSKYRLKNLLNRDGMVKELSEKLFWLMWQGEDHYPFVTRVLEVLREDDLDDDVARAMVLGGHDKDLDDLSASAAGRGLLDSLYEHIITGSLSSGDEQAALLILQAQTRQIPLETYVKGAERAQIFPVLQMGVTRFTDSPLEAELLPNGNIRVKLMSRVQHEKQFAAEVKTLHGDVFLRDGEELRPDEIVGVRDYDRGGQVEFYPATALLMLSNKTETSTWKTIGSVSMSAAGFGLFGAGVAAEGAWANALRWADMTATAVSAIGTVVNEHREWAIATFGARFVRAVDVANSVVAVYGVARLAHAAGSVGVQLTTGLRNRWQALKESKNLARVEAEATGRSVIAEMDRAIESLPKPPETLRGRVAKSLDEWAEQPAGGVSSLGAKEADELLKAGWRKLRNIKPKRTGKAGAGSSTSAPTTSATPAIPKVRTPKPPRAPKPPKPPKTTAPKPVKPPRAVKPAVPPISDPPSIRSGFRGGEEAARVVTDRGKDIEKQALADPGMHVETVPTRTDARRPAAPASPSTGAPLSQRVHVGDLENGLPTGTTGELIPSDLHTGTPSAHDVNPVGQQPGGVGRYGARKGHLLGNVMGGSGRDLGNLAWMHKFVNNSTYKKLFENPVIKALKSGENVRFGVRPKFRGREVAPYEVEVWATTASGKVIVPVRNIRTPGLSDLAHSSTD